MLVIRSKKFIVFCAKIRRKNPKFLIYLINNIFIEKESEKYKIKRSNWSNFIMKIRFKIKNPFTWSSINFNNICFLSKCIYKCSILFLISLLKWKKGYKNWKINLKNGTILSKKTLNYLLSNDKLIPLLLISYFSYYV